MDNTHQEMAMLRGNTDGGCRELPLLCGRLVVDGVVDVQEKKGRRHSSEEDVATGSLRQKERGR